MTCKHIEEEGVIEQYVANRLTGAARKEFELHYFGCDQCFETLEAYQAAGTALKRTSSKPRRWIWPAAVAAAAALVFISVRLFPHLDAPKVQPVQEVAMVVQVEAPPYSVPTLRAVPDAATTRFYRAMEPYQRKDYPAAVEALKKFLDGSPKQGRPFIDAEFFLGASCLLTGRLDDSAAALKIVLAVDSPYLEEAHFLTAETWLKKGDAAQGRAELEKVVAMNGDLKTRAQALLNELN